MNKLERTIAADAAIKAVLLRRRRRRRINALSLALTVGMISAVTALTLIHPAPSTVNVSEQPRPAVAEPPKTVYDTPPSPQQTQETEPERVVRRHETMEEVTSFVDHTIPQINVVTVTEPQRQESAAPKVVTPSAPAPLHTTCTVHESVGGRTLYSDGYVIKVTNSGVYAADSVDKEMTKLPISCAPVWVTYCGGWLHYKDDDQAYLYDMASGKETAVSSDVDLDYMAELDGKRFCFEVRGGKLLQLDPIGGTQEVLFEHERLTEHLALAGHWLFFFADDEPTGAWGSSYYNLQLYRRDLLTGETLALFHVNHSVDFRYADSDRVVFLMGNGRNQFGYNEVRGPFYRYTVYANGDYAISEEQCEEEWHSYCDTDSFSLYEQAGVWHVYDYRTGRVTDLSGWEDDDETRWYSIGSKSDMIAISAEDSDAIRLQMLTLENGEPQLFRTEIPRKEHKTPVTVTRNGVYLVEDASQWVVDMYGYHDLAERYYLRFRPFN